VPSKHIGKRAVFSALGARILVMFGSQDIHDFLGVSRCGGSAGNNSSIYEGGGTIIVSLGSTEAAVAATGFTSAAHSMALRFNR